MVIFKSEGHKIKVCASYAIIGGPYSIDIYVDDRLIIEYKQVSRKMYKAVKNGDITESQRETLTNLAL